MSDAVSIWPRHLRQLHEQEGIRLALEQAREEFERELEIEAEYWQGPKPRRYRLERSGEDGDCDPE